MNQDHEPKRETARDEAHELERFRERALAALREGRFDLAQELIANGDVSFETLIENVRIYQAELEIQNEELTRSQQLSAQALERFSAFFHNTPIAEMVVDRHGLIIEANPAASELFALRDLSAHHHFLLRLVAERDRGSFLDLQRTLTQGEAPSAERTDLRLCTTNGNEFIGDLHGARLPDTTSGEPRILCAVVDRTAIARQQRELKHAYDRLARSQEAYHVLAEYSPDWDYWLSPEGRFIHVSPGCRAVTGYSAGAFLDDSGLINRLIHPDDRPRWEAHLEKAIRAVHRDEAPMLFRLRHRNGGWRWIEHECCPVIADDGRYLGRRGVNRDVTTRQEAEAGVRELRNMLVDAERIAKAGACSWQQGDELIQVSPGWQHIHAADRSAYSLDELSRGFAHPDDAERVAAALRQAFDDQGEGYELEYRIRRADDGSTRWVRTRTEVVRDDGGRTLQVRGTVVDITSEVEAKSRLEESERHHRALFESAAEGMLVLQASRITAINTAALKMLGYEQPEALLGKRPDEISPPMQPGGRSSSREVERLIGGATNDTTAGGTQRFDWVHLHADGSAVPVEVTLVPVAIEGNPGYFVHWHDRTLEAKARQREIQASTVFENTAEAIMVTDAEQRILAVNSAFTQITGFEEPEVSGRSPRMLASGHHDAAFFKRMNLTMERTGSWSGEIWNRRKNGEVYPARMTISRVTDDADELSNYVGLFSDISEAKRSEEELYRLAHSDSLTGLANRALLRARLEQSLLRAKRDHHALALLFMDLDLFKNVNDSLGHSVGDELLIEVAQVITSQVRAGDTVARIGGDEFVILMDDLSDGAEAVAHLAQRLCQRVSQPLQVAERELQLTVSIGISLFPDDGDCMDTLLSNADLAMYRAKDQGRNTYHFFETEMTERAVQRLHLETALRGAIARNELELVYQPQFRLANGDLCGVESLLRWTHPELGTISPAKFIPVAEEIGMISELGRWVLTEACNQLTRWDAEGFRVPSLSVNVSVHQVERIDLIDEIKGIIAATDVDPDRLELEVTESVFMRNVERVVENLNALRDLGIRLAVDDFGSGFSSLGYLKQLPISRLKIDKTFVDGVDTDANDSAIARAVIVLGRALGLEVIAEGVETQAQASFLENEGCDAVQGYLFARPMAAGALRDQHYAVTD
ncbi:EAL domain-containing protein [Halochromatium glycolicum]|uniref:cyclic-guanylate-specific phosphodiesterase n=1 Tax=Halochromatium glycolicum TaxID=85075 RepID=A0AAJ0X9E7_9GAMM|nr:EAL domain-containing protein [Halochromatium glycolicum]MBK1703985.1 hypothetical protein [Halochromatium glycolicum]